MNDWEYGGRMWHKEGRRFGTSNLSSLIGGPRDLRGWGRVKEYRGEHLVI